MSDSNTTERLDESADGEQSHRSEGAVTTIQSCSGDIRGEVDFQDGTPVVDTRVFIIEVNRDETVGSLVTDSNGEFGPETFSCGDYTASTKLPGYSEFATQVNLADSETEKIEVTLDERPQKVVGSFDQSAGVGIIGNNEARSGVNIGVHGAVDSPADGTTGVRGQSTATTGRTYGVEGVTFSNSGDAAGIYGRARGTSGQTFGVYGVSESPGGYGLATPNDAQIEGVVDTSETDFVVEAGTQSTAAAQNVVMGHASNTATGVVGATICGGGTDDGSTDESNEVSGDYATVAGGTDNVAGGQYSFAAGRNANATDDGAFVWGDSSSTAVTAGGNDQVRFQASGGFVVENTQQFRITDGLPGGSGTPVEIDSNGLLVESANVSSVRYKTDIEPLDPAPGEVLELEPRSFEYEESGEEDVGLLAEEADEHVPELVGYDEEGRPDSIRYDRLAVFLQPEIRRNRERIADLESDDDTLRAELERKDERIEDLEADLAAKDARIEKLEDRLAAVEAHVGLDAPGQTGVADD